MELTLVLLKEKVEISHFYFMVKLFKFFFFIYIKMGHSQFKSHEQGVGIRGDERGGVWLLATDRTSPWALGSLWNAD